MSRLSHTRRYFIRTSARSSREGREASLPLSGSSYHGLVTTYRVVVSRDGDGLVARVDGMAAALANGRSIGEIDRNIRGVIAFLEHLPEHAAANLGIVFVDAQIGGANEGLAAPPTGGGGAAINASL